MLNKNKSLETAEDLLGLLDEASLGAIRRRDLKSAVSRVCEMAGCAPPSLRLEVSILRETLRKICPAAHGVSWKTWGNLQSLFRRTLELAGVIDRMDRGVALRHSLWGPLMRSIAHDKRLAGGLAAFANWCAAKDISPDQINDVVLREFHVWLETRTLCPKPRDVVRRIPHVWNEARRTISGWPQLELTTLSFKCPQKHLRLTDLHESFQADVQSYLAMRADPDVFDERPNAPRRRLAKSTLQAQSEHLRLSASVLVESGVPSAEIKSLADLIRPERFKAILRHYHKQANGQPNAFANCLAQTLIQVAKHYAGVTPGELEQLKEIARQASCRSPRAHRQEQCVGSPVGVGAPAGQAALSARRFDRRGEARSATCAKTPLSCLPSSWNQMQRSVPSLCAAHGIGQSRGCLSEGLAALWSNPA